MSTPAGPASAAVAAAAAAQQPVSIPWLGLLAVLLGTFISTLNTRLSSLGLADIRGAVHAGFDEGAWISTAQTVAQMLVTLVAIWLGAIHGARKVLMEAAAAFAVISLLEPFSPNLQTLLLFQFLGGLASGFFIPLTLSFVLRNTPPRAWAYGIAIYALNLEVSLNISASLEGWYTDHLSWCWIFWQNIPFAVGMVACLFFGSRPDPVNPNRPRPDVFGFIFGGCGFALIYAALDQGNRLDWLNSPLVLGLLAAGFLLLVAFVVHEVGGVQEGGLLGADVHEGRLDARQHRVDLAPVDVADHAPCFRAVDLQLNELVVLDDRDANFALRRTDQDLSFHRVPHGGARTATRLPAGRPRRCG